MKECKRKHTLVHELSSVEGRNFLCTHLKSEFMWIYEDDFVTSDLEASCSDAHTLRMDFLMK